MSKSAFPQDMLLAQAQVTEHKSFGRLRARKFGVVSLAALLVTCITIGSYENCERFRHLIDFRRRYTQSSTSDNAALCPQIGPISPAHTTPELEAVFEELKSANYTRYSAELLSGAIQIRTETFDDFGDVGVDRRWDVMKNFNLWLQSTFTFLHQHLQVEYVNTHAPIYTWEGSNPSLKPVYLKAHFDTVPVLADTVDQWTYPPFSGHIDQDGIVWGRGAADDKSQLVAMMQTVELLLKANFGPKRTIILAFGFDEEIGGYHGGRNIDQSLLERFGPDGVAVIVDEGSGLLNRFGATMLVVSTGEKGYANVDITVSTRGGHSSIPPPHTGIGIMAEIISEIERNQYSPFLDDENPIYNTLECAAAYGPEFPKSLKKLIEAGDKQSVAQEVAKLDIMFKYAMTTSIAVTKIRGGTKVNALPEIIKATVNHRLNYGFTTKDLSEKTIEMASAIATKHSLDLIAFPPNASYPQGSITIEMWEKLETAPVASPRLNISTPFKLISGTTRHVFGDDKIVTTGIPTGNTDTKWGWELSKNIFRFQPQAIFSMEEQSFHTVDEKQSVKAHLAMIEWYYVFLRNADETEFDL